MRLSVVVVNWNSREDLRACLASLRAQSHQDLEVIVVDNGSADGSAVMVAAEFEECRLLAGTTNLGFAEGCNRGIEAATGPWIVMLNNDTIADPGWARALVNAATAAPADCGMLQSLMLFMDRPDTINSTGIELTASGGGRDRAEHRPRPAADQVEPEEIFCPTAGAAAYRRTMLEAIRLSDGYFDRNHFLYLEDLDLGWRARIAGWTARYIPQAVVYHKWHGSSGRHGRSWLAFLAGINRIRTLLKNASPLFLVRASPRWAAAVVEVMWYGRPRALGHLLRAIRGSLALRREVSAMARVRRRAVERAWVSASRATSMRGADAAGRHANTSADT
jgi:GT2 family glycosyltransferase